MAEPLIVTLKLDSEAQCFFNALREKYYPKYGYFVPAHCTFFHALPNRAAVIELLQSSAAISHQKISVNRLIHFNNGLAYGLSNETLQSLHANLQQNAVLKLATKDRKLWKPHITIQNKVTAYKATLLYKELSKTFNPFTFTVQGFSCYVYIRRQWQQPFTIPFQV